MAEPRGLKERPYDLEEERQDGLEELDDPENITSSTQLGYIEDERLNFGTSVEEFE